ncbi:hypothetical protein CEUSTIGMA_g7989.t1 [Chlamydomonas eustigma]|uniref:Uncharacterized protein n=1 Tax=Chlamydomonas eustigma TaxID=1157962 RepID=A0A250XCG2_9CHLO|nr:hypothetical protein CEUSTIGMA_g7989.t1 [Chlamydomonas eustigma]|eukprot:GAX80552.1 hypothetical protein CEUSTIGMA_g7989.t1 [Chlamydomonas eustigma]
MSDKLNYVNSTLYKQSSSRSSRQGCDFLHKAKKAQTSQCQKSNISVISDAPSQSEANSSRSNAEEDLQSAEVRWHGSGEAGSSQSTTPPHVAKYGGPKRPPKRLCSSRLAMKGNTGLPLGGMTDDAGVSASTENRKRRRNSTASVVAGML